MCESSANTYSVAAIPGATSYSWTLPSGWTGLSSINSISVIASATSGNIYVSANNECGSSTVQTLGLIVNWVDASVSQSGNVLTANASDATYQWINCLNQANLSGQTNKTFTPSANGEYAVMVTQNDCWAISSCYNVTIVGLIDTNPSAIMDIYPNPSNGRFFMTRSLQFIKDSKVEVYTVHGEKVYQKTITNAEDEIDLSNQAKGIYFIKIRDGQSWFTKRVVIQ